MGDIIGEICALQKGFLENSPTPPNAISYISTIGFTNSGCVKEIPIGFFVPLSIAYAVFNSTSKTLSISVAMQHLVNQLTFSSRSIKREKSYTSFSVDALYSPVSISFV